MPNTEVAMTLDQCVAEVLGNLTGLDLRYEPDMDRYRSVTRQLNRALRMNAIEREWGYYASQEDVGTARAGQQEFNLRSSVRARIIGDDSVRLVDDDGTVRVWAAFLPRDAIEKYPRRRGLWAAMSGQSIRFSRPIQMFEDGLHIVLPVMREPRMFRLPEQPETGDLVEVPASITTQLLDFEYPDAIISRAMFYYAQTDPIMQPRVQTLEADYKGIFYGLNERDDRNTDSPFLNEFSVPIEGTLNDDSYQDWHHPHADERY